MKRPISIFLMAGVVLFISASWVVYLNDSYYSRMRSTKANLLISRQSIHFFYELNGRFPSSLYELDEYVKEFPDKIKVYIPPYEGISSRELSRSEHNVLDGTGGVSYDPNTGELKINLTKPLKSYWPFYFAEGRNEVPADW